MAAISFVWQCDQKYKESSLSSTDAVGDLRRLIQDKLYSDYALEEDPDVQLVCDGVVLEDDDAQLQHVGIGNGSLVHAMSELVAETNGDRKKITCMKDVFDDLKEDVTTSPQDAPPFDVCCPVVDLGELGEGIPILFEFICLLVIVLLGLFLVHMPCLMLFAAGDGLDQWTEVANNQTIAFWYLTAGNLGPNGGSSMVFGVVPFVAGFGMLLAGAVMSQRIRRMKNLVDQTEVDSSDFGLYVENLPQDLVDATFLKDWMQDNLRDEPTEIVNVVVGLKMEEFVQDKAKLISLSKEIKVCEDEGEKKKLQEEYAAVNKTLTDEKVLFEKCGASGAAVVVCRYSKDQSEIVDSWTSFQESLARLCSCFEGLSEKPKLAWQGQEYTVSVKRAALPSDMLWENLGVSFEDKSKARLKVWGILFAVFLVAFALILGGRYLQEAYPGHAFFLILAGFAIAFTTVAVFVISKYTVSQERYESRTEQDFSLVVKFSILYLMNYNIALLIVSQPIEMEWYAAKGLVAAISTLEVSSAICYMLFYGTGCKVCFPRRIKRASMTGKTQAELNKVYVPPEFDTARVYSQIFKIYYLAVFYTPIYPLGALLTGCGLFGFYWMLKKHLVQECKRPYRQSAEMGYRVIKMYFFGVLLYGFSQWYLLQYSLTSEAMTLPSTACTVLVLTSLGFMLAHRRVYQTIFCTFLCFPTGEVADHGDVDYYDAQKTWAKHQKYHTTHGVYLFLENIYAAKKMKLGQTPPWDLKTGNFQKPGDAASDPVTDESAPKPGALGVSAGEDVEKPEDDRPDRPTEATHALTDADPAVLALEEMKYKLPLAVVGDHTSGDVSDDDTHSESEGEAELGATSGLLAAEAGAGALHPGMFATVSDLEDATTAATYNGTICTVIRQEDSGKWLCELEDGKKARLPACKLTPEGPALEPGTKMLVFGLDKGVQFNGSVVTIVRFNKEKKAYEVQSSSALGGRKLNIKPCNLKAVESG